MKYSLQTVAENSVPVHDRKMLKSGDNVFILSFHGWIFGKLESTCMGLGVDEDGVWVTVDHCSDIRFVRPEWVDKLPAPDI